MSRSQKVGSRQDLAKETCQIGKSLDDHISLRSKEAVMKSFAGFGEKHRTIFSFYVGRVEWWDSRWSKPGLSFEKDDFLDILKKETEKKMEEFINAEAGMTKSSHPLCIVHVGEI